MMCPHCLVAFNVRTEQDYLGGDIDGAWFITKVKCPTCDKLIFHLLQTLYQQPSKNQPVGSYTLLDKRLVRPRGSARPPCPSEVPRILADDYTEACLVIGDSPKASAALSRRCLQQLLREAMNVKPSNLSDEIQGVLESHALPTHLAEVIDAVRNIGNFSAHPIKSKSSGEIVPVEPEEAEWNLDVLEALFDFCFVQPAIVAKKRETLNKKLQDAGKPPMKTP